MWRTSKVCARTSSPFGWATSLRQEVVVIRSAYVQPPRRLADWTSLTIPFCSGVRYVQGKPLLRANSGRGTVDDEEFEITLLAYIIPDGIKDVAWNTLTEDFQW